VKQYEGAHPRFFVNGDKVKSLKMKSN